MPDGTNRLRLGGQEVRAMAMLGCMAEYAVVPAMSLLRIDRSIALDRAALVGCGVMTGVGAVLHTAKVRPGGTVAVFGCGGVGLSAIQGARLVGAKRIIAVDMLEAKLEYARHFGATHTVNAADNPVEAIKELTGGWGVDYSFEVTGKTSVMAQAYAATRRGGTVSVPGVYSGFIHGFLFGDAFDKGLSFRMGQTHVHRYVGPLMREIEAGNVDPGFLVTHRLPLASAPDAYRTFRDKQDGCIKVVLDPAA